MRCIYLRSADGCMYGTVYTFDIDDNANNEEFGLSYGRIQLKRNNDDIFDLEFEYLNSSGEIITVSEESLTLQISNKPSLNHTFQLK